MNINEQSLSGARHHIRNFTNILKTGGFYRCILLHIRLHVYVIKTELYANLANFIQDVRGGGCKTEIPRNESNISCSHYLLGLISLRGF